VFYNWAVTDWLRFTADLQYIDSGASDEDVIFAGFGTNVRF
jgi:Carbohydrate-selective porin, OprB family